MENREIKFRAWDKEKNKMYYTEMGDSWSIFEFVGKTQWTLINRVYEAEIITDYHNGILMQFTGLKDKNGKEIYEGDIVNIYKTFSSKPMKNLCSRSIRNIFFIHKPIIDFVSEVCFYRGRYIVKPPITKSENLGMWNDNCIKIIGNIYEGVLPKQI